jgi:hypothetical protein
MKKTYLLLSLIFCICSAGFSQQKTVKVKNVAEFLKAIKSDVTIQLVGKEVFNFASDVAEAKEYYSYEEVYDGFELHIKNVKNLIIQGTTQLSELMTNPQYGNVIVFENCSNIKIQSVNAGHGPQKGSCVGGVFKFVNSNDITIDKSILYGSGIEGITAENVNNLTCSFSTIKECTYGIMTLNTCNNINFTTCQFFDNQEFDLVSVSNSNKVFFNGCTFRDNKTGQEDYSEYALFNLENTVVELNNCTIENNLTHYLCNQQAALQLKNTKLNKNNFAKGEYK